MATGFKEIKTIKLNLKENYVSDIAHARDRIGRMEDANDVVQMNYCDMFGDADGFGIYLIYKEMYNKNEVSRHTLSDAFRRYYRGLYLNRMNYLINDLKVPTYDIEQTTNTLYNYFLSGSQALLMLTKSGFQVITEDEKAIIEACCRAFAEFIYHERSTY